MPAESALLAAVLLILAVAYLLWREPEVRSWRTLVATAVALVWIGLIALVGPSKYASRDELLSWLPWLVATIFVVAPSIVRTRGRDSVLAAFADAIFLATAIVAGAYFLTDGRGIDAPKPCWEEKDGSYTCRQ